MRKYRIGDNRIGPEDAVYIGSALLRNHTLVQLGMRNNCVGDKGALAMGKAMEGNYALRSVNLSIS